MSDRLPRRGDWMGYEGAYICGRGWVPLEEARTWFRTLVTNETGASVVVKEKAGPLVVNSQKACQENLRQTTRMEER